eukprot:5171034-Pyramimonas_sp.AAC.1
MIVLRRKLGKAALISKVTQRDLNPVLDKPFNRPGFKSTHVGGEASAKNQTPLKVDGTFLMDPRHRLIGCSTDLIIARAT